MFERCVNAVVILPQPWAGRLGSGLSFLLTALCRSNDSADLCDR